MKKIMSKVKVFNCVLTLVVLAGIGVLVYKYWVQILAVIGVIKIALKIAKAVKGVVKAHKFFVKHNLYKHIKKFYIKK